MTISSQHRYHGQCLCGSIQFAVDHIEPRMGHCHCRMCRKFHGAAFATFGEAKKEHFHWLAGEELLNSYQADNGTVRQFCSNCGSSLIFKPVNDPGVFIEFALSALDDDVDVFPDAHIFVDYKANWSSICDGLPQYREYRDGESATTQKRD